MAKAERKRSDVGEPISLPVRRNPRFEHVVQTKDLDRLYREYRAAEKYVLRDKYDSARQAYYQRALIAYRRAVGRFQGEQQ